MQKMRSKNIGQVYNENLSLVKDILGNKLSNSHRSNSSTRKSLKFLKIPLQWGQNPKITTKVSQSQKLMEKKMRSVISEYGVNEVG